MPSTTINNARHALAVYFGLRPADPEARRMLFRPWAVWLPVIGAVITAFALDRFVLMPVFAVVYVLVLGVTIRLFGLAIRKFASRHYDP